MPGWGPGTAALPGSLPGGLEPPKIPNSGYHGYLAQLSLSLDRCKDAGGGHWMWGEQLAESPAGHGARALLEHRTTALPNSHS